MLGPSILHRASTVVKPHGDSALAKTVETDRRGFSSGSSTFSWTSQDVLSPHYCAPHHDLSPKDCFFDQLHTGLTLSMELSNWNT